MGRQVEDVASGGVSTERAPGRPPSGKHHRIGKELGDAHCLFASPGQIRQIRCQDHELAGSMVPPFGGRYEHRSARSVGHRRAIKQRGVGVREGMEGDSMEQSVRDDDQVIRGRQRLAKWGQEELPEAAERPPQRRCQGPLIATQEVRAVGRLPNVEPEPLRGLLDVPTRRKATPDAERVTADDEAGELLTEQHVLQQAGARWEGGLDTFDVVQRGDIGRPVPAEKDLELPCRQG
jgi:hypothetical protein